MGDAVTQLQHYSAYKILMSTSLANHIAQDKALEPLLCFNELELEVTEISPRECTKRGGIQSVLDALDPHHGTVYGIGDASNDVSLMNAVDVGIAMGNAPDYLKSAPTTSPTRSTKMASSRRSSTLGLYKQPARARVPFLQIAKTDAPATPMWQYGICTPQRCNPRKNARTRVQSVYQLFSPTL